MEDNPAPRSEDRLQDALADFSADPRLLALSALALLIGAASAGVAWTLVALIRGITALAYHGALATSGAPPADGGPGPWAALVPVAGGLTIGLLARYGSERIRGHGIPEALEAILIGESRMSARVALLKPLPSAIAVVKMLRHGVGRLPVVAREDPRRLVGYLGRANVMAARRSWYRSEHARDRGWATAPRPGGAPPREAHAPPAAPDSA